MRPDFTKGSPYRVGKSVSRKSRPAKIFLYHPPSGSEMPNSRLTLDNEALPPPTWPAWPPVADLGFWVQIPPKAENRLSSSFCIKEKATRNVGRRMTYFSEISAPKVWILKCKSLRERFFGSQKVFRHFFAQNVVKCRFFVYKPILLRPKNVSPGSVNFRFFLKKSPNRGFGHGFFIRDL